MNKLSPKINIGCNTCSEKGLTTDFGNVSNIIKNPNTKPMRIVSLKQKQTQTQFSKSKIRSLF
jgi:hypothetical protein